MDRVLSIFRTILDFFNSREDTVIHRSLVGAYLRHGSVPNKLYLILNKTDRPKESSGVGKHQGRPPNNIFLKL